MIHVNCCFSYSHIACSKSVHLCLYSHLPWILSTFVLGCLTCQSQSLLITYLLISKAAFHLGISLIHFVSWQHGIFPWSFTYVVTLGWKLAMTYWIMETNCSHTVLFYSNLIRNWVESDIEFICFLAVSHANSGVPFVFLFRDSLSLASLPAVTQCLPGTVLIRW